jgi:membrane fusion protein, heavy metal efflux system
MKLSAIGYRLSVRGVFRILFFAARHGFETRFRRAVGPLARTGAPILLLLAAGCGGGGSGGEGALEEHAEGEHVEGEHAQEGSPVVVLDSLMLAMSNVRLGEAEVVATGSLPVTGTITYDANRVSHVGPKTDGRIVGLRADLGAQVARGGVLALLESAQIGALRADLREAQALVEIAVENFEREQRLEAQGISSRRELLDARAELRRAESAMQSAASQLRLLGADDGQGGQFALSAPFAGVVVEKHASLGEVVGPSDQIFTIADLSRLWIELDVFERNLGDIAVGQPVRVTTTAYPSRVFPGEIVYVGDILDPETRTVRARVEVENADGALKPGMFARAEIETRSGTGVETVVVPREAVQDIDGQTMIWVPGGAAGEFVATPVEVGADRGDGRVPVLSGLEAGDVLVTEGAFTLKSELSKGEFGGHSH